MKKLVITLLVVALSGCIYAQDVNDVNVPEPESFSATFRLLGEPVTNKTSVEGWVGFLKDKSEIGILGGYESLPNEFGETEEKYSFGGFAMYHFFDIRKALEETFWLLEWLPEDVEATPALGGKLKYFPDDKAFEISPVFELTIYKNLAIQYTRTFLTDNADMPERKYIGISWTWKF